MISGIIFDIDGTLLDSMPIWEDVGVRYLRSLGITPEPQLSQVLFPMTMEEGAAYIKSRYALPQSTEEIQRSVLRLIHNFYTQEVSLKPGAAGFLQQAAQRHISMVLATSGDADLALAALRRLGAADYFQGLFTCSQLHTSKQEPIIYETAAASMGTSPGDTAVFEDVRYAIQTAKRAGFYTVAVADAASSTDAPALKAEADCYLTDYYHTSSFWKCIRP